MFALTFGIGTAIAPLSVGWAQAPATEIPSAPEFDIVRYAVEGNSLLTAADIERALAGHAGKQKYFIDVQRALEALEQAYRDRGYGLVQVHLPEQDITSGIVRLRVIEPRIGKVSVEGSRYFSAANIRASLPELKPGSTPDSRHIARSMLLLAEHPAKQTTVLLKSGASESEVDATVEVADERPLKLNFSLDNSGTPQAGRLRAGFGVQHSNLFDRDHTLNLQYVTNPEHPGKAAIYGLGYRVPLYAYNSSVEVFAGYSDVDSGTLPGLFNVSGSGTIMGARYNLHLPKVAEYEHKVSFGVDYRALRSSVTLPGAAPVPDVTVHPVSIGYGGLWRMTGSALGFNAIYAHNIAGGNDGRDFDVAPYGYAKPARAQAASSFGILRAGVNYTQVFSRDWLLRAAWNGQYSGNALIASEQFAFGGADSVRGFNTREVANDTGYAANLEIYTPELGARPGWKNLKVKLLTFYDVGTTGRNKIQPGESSGESGGSVGLGARMTYGKLLNLRVDFAHIVDPAGSRARGDQTLHGSLSIVY